MANLPLEIDELEKLERAIGVVFVNQSLLEMALTHQSFVNEQPVDAPVSNERLEFLGDSIVGMVVAEQLYDKAPHLPEGDLTVRRSQVVRRETLAEAAKNIGLGDWLVMGKGETAAGGSGRSSNLADAFEALVGAVFIDKGYEDARSFVLTWLQDPISEALERETRKDPKSLLQEHLQANGSKPPRYQLVSESGSANDIVFTMEVVIDSKSIATGSGSRKVEAERAAASRALEILNSAEQ